ncbi:MAG TPA: tRNA dihydrouridine(20/20a) synthase DusA [Kiloniellales bacterium]|nr:tRNA dihydrouridine(20/20a) synthase DusA [Kiloniellales bacterium]
MPPTSEAGAQIGARERAPGAAEPDRRLSVAPMMDRTDRHDRMFLRLISRRVLLYSEMVTARAILNGDRRRLLTFDPAEHPVALQVGGAEPAELAECARIAADFGYDEINLNVGCPSGRVQEGRFGACLMAEPALVARCVAAMIAAAPVPVTVKTRIGIDERDSFAELHGFAEAVADAGCRSLTVHARKAWLKGLSPKQNRQVPPLRYDRVYALKAALPDLEIVLNGGVASLEDARDHLRRVDGVMIGRAAYENPYLLAEADRAIFGDPRPAPSRAEVVEALLPYVAAECARGVPLRAIARHLLGLYNGRPGARAWRRALSEGAARPDAGPEVIARALARMQRAGEARTAA